MSRIKGKVKTNRTPSEMLVVGVDVSKKWLDVICIPWVNVFVSRTTPRASPSF
jgi:hypothetical protein